VLDFANAAEEIEKAFAPYYDRTILSEATDPNKLYDLQTKLRGFDFYTQDEIDRFATIYFTPRSTQDKLYAALAPIVERYMAANAEDRADFRGSLNDYVRLYAFLSQVISWVDADLEKFYVFARLLLRKLPVSRGELPTEIQRNIDIDSLAVRKTGSGPIKLQLGADPLAPMGPLPAYTVLPQDLEALSQIIKLLNERFGTDFSEDDKLCIQQLEQRLETNDALGASVRANTLQNARLTFDLVVNDLLQDMIDGHFKFYKQVTDNEDFARALLDWLFERYLKRSKATVAILAQNPPLSNK
jgi:type I restriction enzyme, R subunit